MENRKFVMHTVRSDIMVGDLVNFHTFDGLNEFASISEIIEIGEKPFFNSRGSYHEIKGTVQVVNRDYSEASRVTQGTAREIN